jgi:Na+-translocating ferredoxin:NAD+ oxidoreductase subunit C
MTHEKSLLKGGVNPPDDRSISRIPCIANALVPPCAVIPLLQHAGSPAQCIVKAGDVVREGMLIGRAEGHSSANVHASIPGVVTATPEITLPGGLISTAVVIELGGEFDRSGRREKIHEWEKLSAQDLLARIRSAGVVGLGGGGVPAHLKLSPGAAVPLLVANGVESEPSLSADYALLRERTRQIAEALRICGALIKPGRIVLALRDDSRDLVPEIESVFRDCGLECAIALVPSRYPRGHEQLVLSLLDGRSAASVVMNVATLNAIWDAVVLEKPLIDRVLTIVGGPVARPRNLKVRIGTRIGDLFDECGGLSTEPGKVIVGGPMRGVAIGSLDTPVTKWTTGIMAFSSAESRIRREWACVRCGICIEACPWGLVPARLHKLIRMGDIEAARREGLSRCTGCGCCAFACPSHIPLASIFTSGGALPPAGEVTR